MRVIGVVDLRGGLAVHARGGVRVRCAPVDMIAGSRIARGDPLALARAYIVRFGLRELYIADLDAILARPPQDTVIAALAALGTPLWVDAGVSSVDRARQLLTLGVNQVIVGLETLPSYGALSGHLRRLGRRPRRLQPGHARQRAGGRTERHPALATRPIASRPAPPMPVRAPSSCSISRASAAAWDSISIRLRRSDWRFRT